jgi:uncharacterized protein (DUF2236 family)
MRGYFGTDSMAVRALGQRAVALTYGQRALVIGAMHPRLFVGTAQHTSHRHTPYTRLGLTARLFEAVFLGSKDEADRALAFTAKRHAPVRGVTEVDGGPSHPPGSPYSAADPGLMWWTAAFTLDSVEYMYDALVRRLSRDQREALFQDFVTWAGLFGMPREAAPSSYDDFRNRFDTWLYSDEPFLTDEARLVGGYLAGEYGYHLPGPDWLVPPILRTVVTGSLPSRVREAYDLSWGATDAAAWQAICRGSRLAHGGVPLLARTPLLRGRSREFYKVVQRGEQALVRRGGVSMPGVSDVGPTYRAG